MIDLDKHPIAKDDGITHINTHSKSKTRLGRLLSPSANIGEPIQHPLLGPFRTIDSLWCYLNTGGNRDQIRNMEPRTARRFFKLSEKKYSCSVFKEATIDATIIKLQTNSNYVNMMCNNELPFDHYYLYGAERVPIRPSHSLLYIGILNDVKEILLGNKPHEFVQFKDLQFELLNS